MALRWAAQLAGGLARVGARAVAPTTETSSSRLLSSVAVRGPAALAAAELRARAGAAASAPARGYVSLDYVNPEGETIEEIRSRIFGNHIGARSGNAEGRASEGERASERERRRRRGEPGLGGAALRCAARPVGLLERGRFFVGARV